MSLKAPAKLCYEMVSNGLHDAELWRFKGAPKGLMNLFSFRTSVPNISSEHLETASLYFLLKISILNFRFDFRFGFLAKNQYQRWGSHQISLKSSCIFVNFVFLRVLIRPAGRPYPNTVCSEHLFRTSVFPMFLALVEVFGDFRRQIRIQHVELL